MVSTAPRAENREFEHRSGQAKEYTIGICVSPLMTQL